MHSKQVRFDAVKEEEQQDLLLESSSQPQQQQPQQSSSSSNKPKKEQKHFVSRRGRYLSPARRASAAIPSPDDPETTTTTPADTTTNNNNNNNTVVVVVKEYKTFRSPNRKREKDEVPSLCSAGSSSEQHQPQQHAVVAAAAKTTPTGTISCSMQDQTSPLAAASPLGATRKKSRRAYSPNPPPTTFQNGDHNKVGVYSYTDSDCLGGVCVFFCFCGCAGTSSNNNFLSGWTPFFQKKVSLTPPRRHQNLPSLELEDSKLMMSPGGGGIFLSPNNNPATPSRRGRTATTTTTTSFEEKKTIEEGKPSPRHSVNTPTDFAMDYGKNNNPLSASFDTSNVLAWLQSPTANGLFSPGGYASILNTPGGGTTGGGPRTPRTPTVSTSFFFSDVASLPRGGENLSPPKDAASMAHYGAKRLKGSGGGSIANIICISPLASSKARNHNNNNNSSSNATTPNTGGTLKDVFFGSPKQQQQTQPSKSNVMVRGLPLLQEATTTPAKEEEQRVPQRTTSKDPSLDAVHLAERDLMEDEDMSVLLQLASNTTPRSTTTAGVVFRSPNRPKDGKKSGGDNLPALQLPMIGGQEDGAAAGGGGTNRLERKAKARGHHGDANDFAPPQLGMRSSSSSGGSKEIVAGGRGGRKGRSKDGDSDNKLLSKQSSGRGKQPSGNPYPMPPPYPSPRDMPYYPMPPGGPMPPSMPPGPGGSMRVVVGGPPRKGTPPRPGMGGSPHGPPPHYHDYNSPPFPPPGMYSHQYGPPPPPPMGYSTYQGHYPPPPHPPRHMGMYGAAQRPGNGHSGKKGKLTNKGGSSTTSKSGSKRVAPLLEPNISSKKIKRSPSSSSSGTKKKKVASPAITDRVERQKAAATVHAVNQASGGKNDRAAALAAAILRGVTMRPSGKWQAQLYFAGKSRYIGVFDTREKAALAYEIAREKLKSGPQDPSGKSTENLVNAARKAAFEGVNERLK